MGYIILAIAIYFVIKTYISCIKIKKIYDVYEKLVNIDGAFISPLFECERENNDIFRKYFIDCWVSCCNTEPEDLLDIKIDVLNIKDDTMYNDMINFDEEVKSLFLEHQQQLSQIYMLQKPFQYLINHKILKRKSYYIEF